MGNFFLMIRRPPRSTQSRSSAASDVYKRQMESFQEACTPGYYNNEGKPNTNPQNNSYGGGALEYFKLLDGWRKSNKLQGLVTAE